MDVLPLNQLNFPNITRQQLASRKYSAIVVGAGHNGLACAAHLAGRGMANILVLEKNEHIGGACTLWEWKTPKGKLIISPCAYLCALLHPLIVEEMDFVRRGFTWTKAEGGLFIPFADGSSLMLHCDDDKCAEEIRRFAPEDAESWQNLQDFVERARLLLRPNDNSKDIWIGKPPSYEEICKKCDNDPDVVGFLMKWSMVDLLDRFKFSNPKLRTAIVGQGIIGTFATPETPGTAYIYFHHACGRMFNQFSDWGYVKGGMGTISRLLFDVAVERGVTIVPKTDVQTIDPGRGVVLDDGTVLDAPIVISNADPVSTLKLLGSRADSEWAAKVRAIDIIGNCAKVNLAMTALPDFARARKPNHEPHTASVNLAMTVEEWRVALDCVKRGELPTKVWAEIYFQTAFDQSVSPDGLHHVSILVQPVPYQLAVGQSWEGGLRERLLEMVVAQLAQFCTNVPADIVEKNVMVPTDIEERIGLYGGHIFQGECTPNQMWANRLSARTPMKGLYLCGAATHPGGSVIAINGRNAAELVLEDLPL